ncbi:MULTISPECIES: DoxX-like family protein [unclassified Pseudoalteromonas]|uniref:DoxX-like family protein n=1 Tax=Pseudoalteromonas TaxID=53246 RepID=UPI0020162665|nr:MULTISPECIES: DoxX-like family protein [unclassified Pseudoalteromonas]
MRGNNPGYIQIARYIVGLSWIYHGFFPKLYHIAPLEKLMTGSAGFSAEVSDLITRSAGIGEIIFGVCLLVFYKNKHIVILNILAVVVMQPPLLIEAFNPVTTNLPLIGLSFIWLKEITK